MVLPGSVFFVLLPEKPNAQRPDSKLSKALKVISAAGVAGQLHLIEVAIPDPIAGALNTTPQLKRHLRLIGRPDRLHVIL